MDLIFLFTYTMCFLIGRMILMMIVLPMVDYDEKKMGRFDLIGLPLAYVLFFVLSYPIYIQNKAVGFESEIVASSEQSEITLSNLTMKVMEMGDLSTVYGDNVKEIINLNMVGRYGANGNQSLNLFLKEHNITLDKEIYTKIQDVIVNGRDDFVKSQKDTTEKCRDYKNELKSFPSSYILNKLDFPQIDMNHYCNPISDKKTKKSFEEKEQTKNNLK